MAVCYRHSSRETNVACSNCGRPICPDCMTVTPVGMRCPECARERTQVRGIGGGLRAGAAPATYALIALNVAAFVVELAGGGAASFRGGGELIQDAGLNGPAVADGEVWRIVTSGFLHAGFLHIAINMFALFILGGYRGEMAVYVQPNGRFGSAYMAAIAPFRHRIVYPPMLREIGRRWRA